MAKTEPKFKKGSPEFREFMRENGRKGGRANVDKHGPVHMSIIGKRGGEKLLASRGKEYYSELGKRGRKPLFREEQD